MIFRNKIKIFLKRKYKLQILRLPTMKKLLEQKGK